jgi:hypothetical protein
LEYLRAGQAHSTRSTNIVYAVVGQDTHVDRWSLASSPVSPVASPDSVVQRNNSDRRGAGALPAFRRSIVLALGAVKQHGAEAPMTLLTVVLVYEAIMNAKNP